MLSYCWILMMQSTGQTSRHASQPVQLSALMTASSLGSFLRGPALAIGDSSRCDCWRNANSDYRLLNHRVQSRRVQVQAKVCKTGPTLPRNHLAPDQIVE